MSRQFRIPRNFVRHDDIGFCSGGAVDHVKPKGKWNCNSSPFLKEPALLRDSHIILYAVDALVALYASFKKWRNRRLTLRALADLNEHQLCDIGLTRDESGYRALDELKETRRCEQR
ncbi:MAG: DUF1127 domain-containing protein [Pseudolabrys sp.]|jgi:uncharacterized protein YjiS (DUF1127 family)